MAKKEQDRQDLLSEAAGLLPRCLIVLQPLEEQGDLAPIFAHPVVLGWQSSARVRIFFGQDLVFQFNDRGEFLRGHWRHQMLLVEQGKLLAVTKERSERQVLLVKRVLPAEEQTEFLSLAEQCLLGLQAAIREGRATMLEAVEAQDRVKKGAVAPEIHSISLNSIGAWIDGLPKPLAIAKGGT